MSLNSTNRSKSKMLIPSRPAKVASCAATPALCVAVAALITAARPPGAKPASDSGVRPMSGRFGMRKFLAP